MAASAVPSLNGDHAHGLIAQHCRQLVELQGPVLDNRDPEPLRQMDRSVRALHNGLMQFEPALELPQSLNLKRLAKTRRRLALVRDLDRLHERLEASFLPQAPEREVRRLKPVLRQLKRERQLAHDHLAVALRSSAHLEQLAHLQGWLRDPRYTRLGEEPLAGWQREWAQEPPALMLHRGWWVAERGEESASLRDLSERIEALSARLGNLPQPATGGSRSWLRQLRRGRDLLSELNDLTLLHKAIDDQLRDGSERTVPQLDWLLEQHHLQCWRQWRELAAGLMAAQQRRRRPLQQLATWQGMSAAGRIRAGLISLAGRLS